MAVLAMKSVNFDNWQDMCFVSPNMWHKKGLRRYSFYGLKYSAAFMGRSLKYKSKHECTDSNLYYLNTFL